MLRISIVFKVNIQRSNHSPEQRKEEETSSVVSGSFSTFAREEIVRTRRMHRHSTAGNYATALRSLLKFHGDKNITFSDMGCELIDAYGAWLQRKGVCKDTLSCYMRSLRAIYNKAVEHGLTEQKEPFKNVFTGISRTRKRSIEKTDINKLRNVKVKPGSFMQLVRDVFLFCFYACGMPFVDVAFLKKSQITDGVLAYHRRKTNQFVQIKLEPCMEEIINRYRSDDRSYVFPFLTSQDEDTAYREYKRKFTYYNKVLKILGKQAGINKALSSYVARHTWATLAFMSSVDMPVIAQALGHTNIKTTQIYVGAPRMVA
ncbi:tyrosine-type recombinase/integrase [Bacteroides clarus]|uniref:tyrosine-type recombinase/integrase n=1 Tax=Bacteroides clarus TaxID=626929 RepID=UPI0024920679|nr:site-specific integrase [Bacteroides clarus]